MAVPRSLAFLRRGTGLQSLEVYLDPCCPFCAKIERSLKANVFPLIDKGGKYDGKLNVIARLYPQPFHYVSPVCVEALLLFGYIYPDQFWSYLSAVYDNQKEFFNVPSQDVTPVQLRDKLAQIAVDVLEKEGKAGKGPASQVYGQFSSRLAVKPKPDGSMNGGNETLNDMKQLMKVGRQNGVHVTPTVLFDGLKEDSISSSWSKEEWEKFLADKFD